MAVMGKQSSQTSTGSTYPLFIPPFAGVQPTEGVYHPLLRTSGLFGACDLKAAVSFFHFAFTPHTHTHTRFDDAVSFGGFTSQEGETFRLAASFSGLQSSGPKVKPWHLGSVNMEAPRPL